MVSWMLNSQANRLMANRWGDDWCRSKALVREARNLLHALKHDPGGDMVNRYKLARKFVLPW